MFSYTCLKILHKFDTIGLIAESTLILVNNTKGKNFDNAIFEMKDITQSGLIFPCSLEFTTTKNLFNNFFKLVSRILNGY